MLVYNESTGEIEERQEAGVPIKDGAVWICLNLEEHDRLPSFLEQTIHPHIKKKLFDLESIPTLAQLKNQLFFSLTAIGKDLTPINCTILVIENYVVTILKSNLFNLFSKIKESFIETPESMTNPFKILYHILNAFFMLYLQQVDTIADKFQDLEGQVFKWPFENDIARQVYRMKQHLHRFRQIIEPLDALITKMEDPDFPYKDEDISFYSQDLRNSYNRIVQALDQFSGSFDGIFNLQMSLKADHTNTIVKTLTLFSVIFIPMTFIAGLYGMNFKYMPELNWSFGYFYALILMFGVGALLAFYFYLKGWWGRSKKQK
ncbi:CorA family divalent cation transporter [Pullulanibacillus sp. KACC 23026]|uniref:magnesium transporter CorA family protein n=1 Tax=Pullulanibacillus sp. KACC 23026 TaxID=3028315 RepID=UPI0023AF983B|nr:CorA family divalent cation transporter [Pullulanibacillus sp. KACC 23026]WEG12126.1 CorA family divalent cation transporter [Pullulanibacillus sp. KACC 23026]